MAFRGLPKVHRFRCDISLDGELLGVEAVEPSLADEPYRGRDYWLPEPSFAYFFRASGANGGRPNGGARRLCPRPS